jgi:hypothetical protein
VRTASEPFADLPWVLALAEQPNGAIKITGAGTLAHEPFPYPDLWEPLGRIFDRCGWTAVSGALTGPGRRG